MPDFDLHRRLVAWLLILLLAGSAATSDAQTRSRGKRSRELPLLQRHYGELQEKFRKACDEIARFCDEKNLTIEAEHIRSAARTVDSDELRLTPLPRNVQPGLRRDLPADEQYWRAQLRFQEQEYSKELYLLSRRALAAGHVGFSYDLVREVALHDPDHAPARKILGFVRSGDEWMSPFEASMLRAKKRWHDQFGWLPYDHVERYVAGERYYRNRWISAAKEAELRRDFSNAWEVRTEHYLVRTNHSLEQGVELAKKLENFHGVFFHLMAGFFNTPEQMRQLFAGQNGTTSPPRPNVVHFYRTRDEYMQALRKETNQPVEITRGMYFPRNGIAFFFYDPDAEADSTLYHEATHQLLSGSRPQTGEIGIRSDFWIIEGIACYMESFHRHGESFSVGDPEHDRIRAAQAHLLNEQYYVPIREFTRMGMQAFQTAQEIRKNYSQAAALAHFFLHYENGLYRDALIEYLSQIYTPVKATRESPESLEDLTGVEAEELDGQYREYIKNLTSRAGKARVSARN
jgi:hypothetical protein